MKGCIDAIRSKFVEDLCSFETLQQLIKEHFELKAKVDSVQRSLGKVDMFELLEAIIDHDEVNGNKPCFPIKYKFRIISDEDYDKLSPLFDNNPYEQEDLKPNMWIWDNKFKIYYQFKRWHNNSWFVAKYSAFIINDGENRELNQGLMKFEPNRFYPREVKDNG